jgi:hypothetical protein
LRTKNALAAVLLVLLLSGCERLQDVSESIWPPTTAEMTARVKSQAEQGDARKAIESGERFLQKHPDSASELHRLLASLYLEQGDAPSSVRHLMKADGDGHDAIEPAPALPPGASAQVLPDGSVSVRAGGTTARTSKDQ